MCLFQQGEVLPFHCSRRREGQAILEKNDESRNDETNHHREHGSNEKSFEVHRIVFVTSHPFRPWKHHKRWGDGANDEPIEDQPVHQIKQEGHSKGTQEDIEKAEIGRIRRESRCYGQ